MMSTDIVIFLFSDDFSNCLVHSVSYFLIVQIRMMIYELKDKSLLGVRYIHPTMIDANKLFGMGIICFGRKKNQT